MLTIINPTPLKRGPKAKGKKMATRKKKGMPAGLKRYWAKVRAGKRHHNPAPAKKHRRVHRRNRVVVYNRPRRRVHRNPSGLFGGGGIFGELMTTEGLMMVGAVALTPTVESLVINQFAPTLTGYTRIAAKAAVGLGVGFAAYKFLNKKAGMVAAVAALGIAAAEVYNVATKQAPVSGYLPPAPNYGNLRGYGPYVSDEMGEVGDVYDEMSDDLQYAMEPGTRWV